MELESRNLEVRVWLIGTTLCKIYHFTHLPFSYGQNLNVIYCICLYIHKIMKIKACMLVWSILTGLELSLSVYVGPLDGCWEQSKPDDSQINQLLSVWHKILQRNILTNVFCISICHVVCSHAIVSNNWCSIRQVYLWQCVVVFNLWLVTECLVSLVIYWIPWR